MIRGQTLNVAFIVVLLAVAGCSASHPTSAPAPRSSGPAPVSASTPTAMPSAVPSVLAALASSHRSTVRSALVPALAKRATTAFPPGNRLVVQPGSWHQAGAYANVRARLRGHRHGRYEIGFVQSASGAWQVIFAVLAP